MKTFLQLLAGLCLAACVASASAELSPIPFVVGPQDFKAGDVIVIDQVLATSPKLEPGATVVVRGHYRLASCAGARLGLFVTHRSRSGPDRTSPAQIAPVEGASGAFELSCTITADGDPHVSFYPAAGGQSFGGVYFSPANRRSREEEAE